MDIVSWTLAEGTQDENKPLYIDPNDPTRCLSMIQTRRIVRRLVSGFRSKGLRRGDCVCVMSFNDIHYSSLVLGIIGAGGCFTGANPGYTEYELRHHVQTTGAKFLLVEPKLLNAALAVADACDIPHSNLFLLDFNHQRIPKGQQSWSRLLEYDEEDWVSVDDPDDTTAAYFSTSGTSGLPKAAVISHSYLVSQGEVQVWKSAVSYELSTLISLPPFHAFTFPLQHIMPLKTQTPCYVMARFDQHEFVDAAHNFQITQTAVVPPVMAAVSNCGNSEKLLSLRRVYTAGSRASSGMQQRLYDKLRPDARIDQIFGMTECGWVTSWERNQIDLTGSIGQPLPGFDLRLVDEGSNALSDEAVTGEIEIFVPHPMRRYLDNPIATAEMRGEDGWIRTGDVGYRDCEGSWHIVDRTKDLIKVRGWQVSPAEIEIVLLEHPEVSDAAVIGTLAVDDSGEAPTAFVVTRFGSNIHEKQIKSFLATKLAKYKMVESVHFVDRIPRNASGKILRRILRGFLLEEEVTDIKMVLKN